MKSKNLTSLQKQYNLLPQVSCALLIGTDNQALELVEIPLP